MYVEKPAEAPTGFDKGLIYDLGADVLPYHISFYFSSSNVDTEDTNLRLYYESDDGEI